MSLIQGGSEIKTRVMDHHGLVAAVCRDFGLVDKINARIGSKDPRRVIQPGLAVAAMIINGLGFTRGDNYPDIGGESHKSMISNGTLLVAMILNGLGFVSRTLHMYPEYFSEKPTERLLGKGILPSHINEDVMGRFLDSLYELGVSGLYQEIALRVVKYLKLPFRW